MIRNRRHTAKKLSTRRNLESARLQAAFNELSKAKEPKPKAPSINDLAKKLNGSRLK